MDVLNMQCVKLRGVWSISVVHMWSLFITEKLIDSKLKKQGRDVIKQSVIFAPENKVSCLNRVVKWTNFFFKQGKLAWASVWRISFAI